MLDLKRLRVLREVAEQGSFSAAADTLYVSQSAISQQISALEAEVGTPLLLRLRSGPVLTDAGQLLVSHGDAAICRLEQAERELAELCRPRSGRAAAGQLLERERHDRSPPPPGASPSSIRTSGSASPRPSPRTRSGI